MIEWLLTGDNLLHFCIDIATISILISIVLNLRSLKLSWSNIKSSKRTNNITVLLFLNSLLFFGGYFFISGYIIEEEYIKGNEWKEVYNNDIGAEIELDIEDEYNIKFRGGKDLGSNYLNLSKGLSNRIEGIISAEKDGEFEDRKVIIEKDNIIINGELDPKSRISKIEYRNIEGIKKKAFGYYSKDIRPYNKDGELRITIEGKRENKELKELFDK